MLSTGFSSFFRSPVGIARIISKTPVRSRIIHWLLSHFFHALSTADSETVQKNLMAVSGTTKGEKCESYEDCVALMKSGKEIQYVGKTSIGVFNNAHDPSTASIGIYEYDDSNVPVFLDSQEGAVPQN